jgi:uncharacterized protein YqgC (DUF456 family)
MFGGILLQSYLAGFSEPSVNTLLLLGVLTILVFIFDILSGPIAAKFGGASKYGIWGAILGAVLGLLLLPIVPIFILFGPFLGAVAGELASGKTQSQALKSGASTLMGVLITLIIKFFIALYFIYIFVMSFL